jgi:hypothetical protein
MSRGPGRIERAIRARFDELHDRAHPSVALALWCFDLDDLRQIERKHRVSVLRAARNVIASDPRWTVWRVRNWCNVFVNEASETSREDAKRYGARAPKCCPRGRLPSEQHLNAEVTRQPVTDRCHEMRGGAHGR